MVKDLQGSWKAQAVAFDMDGLMFDTEGVYYRAAETLLSRRGYHYTQSLCDEVMGRPPEYCFRRFIEVFSLPEDWRALQEESEDIFIELLKDGYGTTPGLLGLLDELDKRGLPRCVCTSSARRVAMERRFGTSRLRAYKRRHNARQARSRDLLESFGTSWSSRRFFTCA